MFHIGEDYVKTFENHFNSDKANTLFEKAKQLKNAERAIFVRRQKRHKRMVWFCLIAFFVVIIYLWRDILPILVAELMTNLRDNIMEQGWAAIAAIVFIALIIVRASRRTKASKYITADRNYFRGEYANFYMNQILPWLVEPLSINTLKLVINEGSARKGSRKGRRRNTPPSLRSVSYKINKTQVQLDRANMSTQSRSFVRGNVWRTQMNIANPLPYDIRIINTEATASNSLATIKLFGNDTHKFEFNTIEMAKKFECYISIGKGRKTDNPFDEMFEGSGVLGLAAGAFAQKAKKVVESADVNLNEIHKHADSSENDANQLEFVGNFTKSFFESAENNSREASRQKMEDYHLDVHRMINPVVEETLLFIRNKYGPYNLVVGKGMRIEIAREADRIKNLIHDRQEGLTLDLFTPSLTDDSDISYERLIKIYEIFLLSYLLDKNFNEGE